jgi:hypothetical protein
VRCPRLALSALPLLLISCNSNTCASRSNDAPKSPTSSIRNLYPGYDFEAGYDYQNYDERLKFDRHIKATLSCNQPAVRKGEPINFEIRIDVLGDGATLYNVQFYRYMPLPAVLAVFDNQKRYLGDMLSDDPRYPHLKWFGLENVQLLHLGAGDYIGIHVIQIPQVPPRSPNDPTYGTKLLGPGRYTVQLIFYKAFAQVDPRDAAASPWEECFRSNAIQIEITASDALSPPTNPNKL